MINGNFQGIDGMKVMGGSADRGFLGGFDRPPNAEKFPWGDRGWAKVIDYPVEAVLPNGLND